MQIALFLLRVTMPVFSALRCNSTHSIFLPAIAFSALTVAGEFFGGGKTKAGASTEKTVCNKNLQAENTGTGGQWRTMRLMLWRTSFFSGTIRNRLIVSRLNHHLQQHIVGKAGTLRPKHSKLLKCTIINTERQSKILGAPIRVVW
jgi:hypothetical protein